MTGKTLITGCMLLEDGSAELLTDWFVSVEPFFDLNTTDWGGSTGISQNRAQLGLGMTVQPGLRLEAGFMQQYFYLDGRENTANDLAIINLKWQY
jgi:hypothetical protein